MIRIEKGEYECPKCKKFTVIGRTKKAEEPLTCCDTEMVKQDKKKFTEHPEPKAAESGKKTKTKAKAKAKAKRKTSRSKKKKVEIQAQFPLPPGTYRCPACGVTRELKLTDNREKYFRCELCFVKMAFVSN